MSISSSGPAGASRRKLVVWAVPVVVTGAVIAAAALSAATASNATPRLPARSAAQLLVDVQTHADTALSGTVKETANLGLPSLPDSGSQASLTWQTFLTGSHEVRLWVDGPDRQRAALIGRLSEADVIHNGRDLWTYTSQSNSASHTVLNKAAGAQDRGPTTYNPARVASDVLRAVSPSTVVSVEGAHMVAGRATYTLVLTPKDKNSTVRRATISIDSTKYVPLQVAIYGSAAQPAFKIGFSNVSFSRPAASTFNFRVPAGASVTKDPFGLTGVGDRHRAGQPMPAGPRPGAPSRVAGTPSGAPTIIGSGWTTVAELHGLAGRADPIGLGSGPLRDVTSSVGSSGERLLHTSLVNAVFLPDGRVFVGAVKPAVLEHIAATTPR